MAPVFVDNGNSHGDHKNDYFGIVVSRKVQLMNQKAKVMNPW
jgi:hypothetical protein